MILLYHTIFSMRSCLFILLLFFVFNATFALANEPNKDNTYNGSSCKDDIRLINDLETLLSIRSTVGYITVTPTTFIRLNPKIRTLLVENILICPKLPLNAKGKPLIPMPAISFYDVWEKIEISIGKGDWQEIAFIRDTVTVKPLPHEGIFSLLNIPIYNTKTMTKLAKILGITPFTSEGHTFFFIAEVFRVLKGKVDMPPMRMNISNSSKRLSKARAKAEYLGKKELFFLYTGAWEEQAIRSLWHFGIDAIFVER